MESLKLSFTLNGKVVQVEVEQDRLLVDVIRTDLGLTGTKKGCGEGACGACTVIIDGKSAHSCLVLAAQVDGSEIVTIEGMADGETLHPLQAAFIEEGAVQCGFCSPGMLLSAKALLDTQPHPQREEILEALSGNLCRCTGYGKIVAAIESVSTDMTKAAK